MSSPFNCAMILGIAVETTVCSRAATAIASKRASVTIARPGIVASFPTTECGTPRAAEIRRNGSGPRDRLRLILSKLPRSPDASTLHLVDDLAWTEFDPDGRDIDHPTLDEARLGHGDRDSLIQVAPHAPRSQRGLLSKDHNGETS